jgi:hypothetical protein
VSALDQIRRRHAAEVAAAELEANLERQLSPEAAREIEAEGARIAREGREAERAAAAPITGQPLADLEAELVALEAEAESIESRPQKRAGALRHMAEAGTAAQQAFDAAFDAQEFLAPVSAERLAELASLWVAGSRAFRDELRERLMFGDEEQRPEPVPADWQPRLVVVHHRLVALRAEIWRRKSEARVAERLAGRQAPRKGLLRAAVGVRGGAAIDAEDDLGHKGPSA